MASNEEIRTLVQTMRELGVKSYRSGDVVIELGDAPIASKPAASETAEERELRRARARRTHEDLLFASSEGFPDYLLEET